MEVLIDCVVAGVSRGLQLRKMYVVQEPGAESQEKGVTV